MKSRPVARAIAVLICLLGVGCSDATPGAIAVDAATTDIVTDVPVACPAQQTRCDGTCTNLQTDPSNCGACGASCGAPMVCVAGTCRIACPAPQTVCGGQCVSFQTDPLNCGACGNACPAGQMCSIGRCGVSCDRTLATCGAGVDGGVDGGAPSYCADTRTDRLNRGECMLRCLDRNICTD